MGDESGDSGGIAIAQTSTIRKTKRKHTKRTGEISEAAFLLKAQSLGFNVSKPWGDSERYDFIVDNGQRLWRAQIKCTEYLKGRGYDVQPIYTDGTGRKTTYTAADIDVLIAHVVPVDAWYVLPVEAFAPAKSLRFYPDGGGRWARFEEYREAWYVLSRQSSGRQPSAISYQGEMK